MSQVYTVVSHPAILLMSLSRVALTLTLCVFASRSHADELVSKKGTSQTGASQTVACATSLDPYFVNQVWAKLGSQKCLTCHQPGGDAEESEFLLSDPHKASGAAAVEVMRANRDAFVKLAKIMESDQSLLLLKASGELDHGGGIIAAKDSAGYRVLAEFVRRQTSNGSNATSVNASDPAKPLLDNVSYLSDRALLRRAVLSLAGRLPTPEETKEVEAGGMPALRKVLDQVLQEDAFYDRLREAFNDIFLTLGYGEGAESALAYDHFSKTRHWTQNFNLDHIADEKERRQARYKLADDYRAALLGEPMKLIEHIVRNDHPFTEIVTADYIMVTPYTARGYGIYDELADQFENKEDPFEYIPVRLKALVGRNRIEDQESKTGFYPHAGLLSTFQYLRRYPTTETNRNRLRARMYYLHFLGIDALELADRVSDAAAVTSKYEVPTMQASECVVCHRMIDPVASLFQDFYKFEGVYGRRKGGWYQDMFQAGYEGVDMPADERWRSLQWLGEQTIQDPRFAVAMVEHAYYLLTGRKALKPPKEIDDPLFDARYRAYRAQRCQIESIAQNFRDSNFSFKEVLKDWITSDYYRIDGLASDDLTEERLAELDDVGIVRLLAPEQVERKIKAVFGKRWGRLTEQTAMLYGGIDSQEVTERATDPSGAAGAIQRIMSNDVACQHTLQDFMRPKNERLLFPEIEPSDIPGQSAEQDAKIKQAIVLLHERILGLNQTVDSNDVARSFDLFCEVIDQATEDDKLKRGIEKQESYYCRNKISNPIEDTHYTIRAWRAVITYLLRRPEFLYE